MYGKFKFYFLEISGSFELQLVESANAEPVTTEGPLYVGSVSPYFSHDGHNSSAHYSNERVYSYPAISNLDSKPSSLSRAGLG